MKPFGTSWRAGAAALGLALWPAIGAQAQAAGEVYGGLSVGTAHSGEFKQGAINEALQNQGLAVRAQSVDDSPTGWKVYGGYRLTRHLALELAYTYFGMAKFEGQVTGDPGKVQAGFKAEDLSLSAVGHLPLGEGFDLIGRAGLGYWHARLQASGVFAGSTAHGARSGGASPLVGLGGQVFLSPVWSARAEWERHVKVGDAKVTGRADLDLWALGVQYRF